MHVAADPELAAVAASLGHLVVPAETLDQVRDVEVVLVGGPEAWSRVRLWRANGVRAGMLVHRDGESPSDRALLEPVVSIRDADRESVRVGLARLAGGRVPSQVRIVGGQLDREAGRFVTPRGSVTLTDLETRLLAYLAGRPGRAVDRDELQAQVWDHRTALATKAVEMAVARLRKKIEPDPVAPTTVLTVRNGGYCAASAPVTEMPASRPGLFVGREAVVADLVERLSSRCTTLAVLGPPGIGKSRVAHEVLVRLLSAGLLVRKVDLDALPAAGDAAVGLATALDVDLPSTGDPWAALIAALAEGILIVDHGEQRPDVMSALARAAAGRWPMLIATQVAPVGEPVELRVLPLLDDDAASALLADRSGGIVDAAGARLLVPLLDGLPLALTLAAAQVTLLGVEAFCAAMDQRLALLSPEGAGRHTSVARAIAEAVGRLPPDHEASLRTLLVFRGPFALADARSLLGDRAALSVADLVGRGMLVREGSRYRILHALRDHLLATGAVTAAAETRHLEWAVERVLTLHGELRGLGDRAAHAALAALQADLEAALARALDRGAPREVALLAEGIDLSWTSTGTLADRRALVERVEGVASADPEASARMAWLRARLAVNHDRVETRRLARIVTDGLEVVDPVTAARARFVAVQTLIDPRPQEALQWLLGWNPPRKLLGRARALRVLCHEGLGELTVAQATPLLRIEFEDLLAQGSLFDAVNVGMELALHLGVVAPHQRAPFLERLEPWCALLRDPRVGSRVRLAMGLQYTRDGRLPEARTLLLDADAAYARFEPGSRVDVTLALGEVEHELGRYGEARDRWSEVVEGARVTERIQLEIVVAVKLARLEADAGRLEAARAWAARAADLAATVPHPHYRIHAALLLAMVTLLAGDTAGTDHALRDVQLSGEGGDAPVMWRTIGVVLGAAMARLEPHHAAALEVLVTESLDLRAPEVRRVTHAGSNGHRDALLELLRDDPRSSVEVRLLARIWLCHPAYGAASTDV